MHDVTPIQIAISNVIQLSPRPTVNVGTMVAWIDVGNGGTGVGVGTGEGAGIGAGVGADEGAGEGAAAGSTRIVSIIPRSSCRRK